MMFFVRIIPHIKLMIVSILISSVSTTEAQNLEDGRMDSSSIVTASITLSIPERLSIKTEVKIPGVKTGAAKALNGEFCVYSNIHHIQTTTLGSDNSESEIFLKNNDVRLPIDVDVKTIEVPASREGTIGCLPGAAATRIVQVDVPEHLINTLPTGVYTGTLKVILEPL